jgi:hypothetical protein
MLAIHACQIEYGLSEHTSMQGRWRGRFNCNPMPSVKFSNEANDAQTLKMLVAPFDTNAMPPQRQWRLQSQQQSLMRYGCEWRRQKP